MEQNPNTELASLDNLCLSRSYEYPCGSVRCSHPDRYLVYFPFLAHTLEYRFRCLHLYLLFTVADVSKPGGPEFAISETISMRSNSNKKSQRTQHNPHGARSYACTQRNRTATQMMCFPATNPFDGSTRAA